MSAAANAPSSASSMISMASTLAFRSAAIARRGDLLALADGQLAAGDLDLLLGALADQAVAHGPVHRARLQVQAIHRVERADDLVGAAQAERAQEHRRQELALAVDADVQQVLGVVLELHPRPAIRDDLRDEEGLVLGVEERARRPVQLADDDALGAVDDERAVLGHQRDVAEVDLLLLDVADGLHPRLRVLVPDHEPDGDLQRHGVGHAALLALVDVVLQLHRDHLAADVADVAAGRVGRAAARAEHFLVAVRIGDQRVPAVRTGLAQVLQALELAALALPVADGVLDELERRVLPEVADREDGLEHRLQSRVLALGGEAVHLQETFVALLLYFDQVRNRNRRLDLREIDALAVDVLRQAVHAFRSPLRPSLRAGIGKKPPKMRSHPEPTRPWAATLSRPMRRLAPARRRVLTSLRPWRRPLRTSS